MNRDRLPPRLPPDWEPPSADTPEDIDRSNRFVGLMVLSVFGAGIAVCLLVLWSFFRPSV